MFLRACRIYDESHDEFGIIFFIFSELRYPRFFFRYIHLRNVNFIIIHVTHNRTLPIISYYSINTVDGKRCTFKEADVGIVFTLPDMLPNTTVKRNAASCALETSPGIHTVLCKAKPVELSEKEIMSMDLMLDSLENLMPVLPIYVMKDISLTEKTPN